jgi:hypothetical protein
MVFSDTSLEAQFAYESAGLDIAFSLNQGTAFPALFAAAPGDFGAVAEDTYMSMIFRVAPGVVSDPELFWSGSLSGAVDLFQLDLVSDAFHNVDATLTLGTSTADFALDSSGVAGAEAAIEAAFTGNGGTLLADLEDLFTVGFVPDAGVDEYTVGMQRNLKVAAWEVPEPSSWAIAITGLAPFGLARLGRRRFKRSSWTDYPI